MKIFSVLAKSPEKQNLNLSHSALFHMKSRVHLKYFVNDCRLNIPWCVPYILSCPASLCHAATIYHNATSKLLNVAFQYFMFVAEILEHHSIYCIYVTNLLQQHSVISELCNYVTVYTKPYEDQFKRSVRAFSVLF